MRLLLDISRLIDGSWRAMPTGIDRVELAYARHWLKKDPERVTFLLRGPLGSAVAVPRSLVSDFVQALETRRIGALGWEDAARPAAQLARSAIIRLLLGRGMLDLARALRAPEESIYVLVSHALAERPRPIAAIKRKGVKFIPLVHDLIPVAYPEYTSPAGVRRHMRRIEAFAGLADGIIVNSQATADDLGPHLLQNTQQLPRLCAPLGIDTPIPDPNYPAPAGAYFVCIGTIEPRKNHLLLLNTWRVFAERLGVEAPKLLLIGRRGWENENILDMLDRCPAMIGLVREYKGLPDKAVASLLQGARALLFPSFAEGYGLPLAEALALGVPAICSDLPALREVGGDAPEFLDPLDGLGWRRLILNYAEPDSGMREAQLERIGMWSRPSWEQHFALVDPWLRQIACAGQAKKAPSIPAEAVHGVTEARLPTALAQGP
ncbi:MAG: glycosyltransferase family 4 protein [Roseomonas sp.]|nr:glycosyltransferase family 4 protein [Roseomonas sp.]